MAQQSPLHLDPFGAAEDLPQPVVLQTHRVRASESPGQSLHQEHDARIHLRRRSGRRVSDCGAATPQGFADDLRGIGAPVRSGKANPVDIAGREAAKVEPRALRIQPRRHEDAPFRLAFHETRLGQVGAAHRHLLEGAPEECHAAEVPSGKHHAADDEVRHRRPVVPGVLDPGPLAEHRHGQQSGILPNLRPPPPLARTGPAQAVEQPLRAGRTVLAPRVPQPLRHPEGHLARQGPPTEDRLHILPG